MQLWSPLLIQDPMPSNSLHITWECIWDCEVLTCSCGPFCQFHFPCPPTPFALQQRVLGTVKVSNCSCGPFSLSGLHALQLCLHYYRGYLELCICLNANMVPFVSLGSHDSLDITWEVIWYCQSGNCTCVPFCWSRIPFPPTPLLLHGRVLESLKVLYLQLWSLPLVQFPIPFTPFALPQRVLGTVVVHPILLYPVNITAEGPECQGPFFCTVNAQLHLSLFLCSI